MLYEAATILWRFALPHRGWCGHHPNLSAGFWRAMQEAIGAGRCLSELHQLYQHTRQEHLAYQERPIYAFSWERIPPHTSRDLLSHSHIQKVRKITLDFLL